MNQKWNKKSSGATNRGSTRQRERERGKKRNEKKKTIRFNPKGNEITVKYVYFKPRDPFH